MTSVSGLVELFSVIIRLQSRAIRVFLANGLENHDNSLEIVRQALILIALDSGFCPALLLSVFTAAIRIWHINRAATLKPARKQR